MSTLVLYVRLHDGRYHGNKDWPPAPARLFQALVAGAGLRGPLGEADQRALKWLERQKLPIIAAPLARRAERGVLFYMPNNDSDAIAGDPLRMPQIRTATKTFRPYFFDAAVPFVYLWKLSDQAGDEEQAAHICALAEHLYRFGLGIDMAWARGEVLDDQALDDLLAKHPGWIFRPSAVGGGELFVPVHGSLESLIQRHRAQSQRFRYWTAGRSMKVIYRKPPPARFGKVSYDSPPSRRLYELHSPVEAGAYAPWPLTRVLNLVVRLRDRAVQSLKSALPAQCRDIERILVGRQADGSHDGPTDARVRIIPLPSIGHFHADRQIRRVMIEVPPSCPLHPNDVHWAFSGLYLLDTETGEIEATLLAADDHRFLRHYGLTNGKSRGEGFCLWRTITPIALPLVPPRKPVRTGEERRAATEQAAAAVLQALRHAGLPWRKATVTKIQREPFDSRGTRAEDFANGTRFIPQRLWHVEIAFDTPLAGPMVIGDGRFLGLGLMAPAKEATHLPTPSPEFIAAPEVLDET